MKTKLILFVLGLFFINAASAKIWRVNNDGNAADFISLAVAINTIPANDTIHLEGSGASYNTEVPIAKKVTIIGPGYFLNENPNASFLGLSARVTGYIHFDPGSEGSQLIGVRVSGSFKISTNNIVIKRCLFDAVIEITGMNGSIHLTNIIVVQNYFSNPNRTFSGNAIFFSSIGTVTSEITFNNNICERKMEMPTYFTFSECKNNFFDYGTITNTNNNPVIAMGVGVFQNNILNAPGGTVNINNGTNNNVSYNVSSSATGQFGTADHNIFVPDMTTVFVDRSANTPDGDYQLRTSWSSLSENIGADATQRGVFGGAISNRYTLSGLPPIPVIYQISSSGIVDASGLPVTIKARTIQ